MHSDEVLGGLAKRAVSAALMGRTFDVTAHEYWILRRQGAFDERWDQLVIAAAKAVGAKPPFANVEISVKPLDLIANTV